MPASLQDVKINLILPDFKAQNSKQVLHDIAYALGPQIFHPAETIFRLLMEKEAQASSAIGDGIAIPHLKLDYIHNPLIALTVLSHPVHFKAPDRRPVDIICLLLSPAKDGPVHLQRLARLTRLLTNPELGNRLREAENAEVIRALLIAPEEWLLAA